MALRKILDDLEPYFTPGGKYDRWYALYEAVDTIFYRPSSVTKGASHVRDGIDLKRIMITVWLAAFPAMFYGMYNVGHQANLILAAGDIAAADSWRVALTGMLAGFDPNSIWDCFIHGAMYFVPIYLVTFVVCGIWEVLFAIRRGHEINEGFFVT
ncbi:MAG: NADH:ubiquinone reductase (Na(+)-transporting) subunit B, partial [Pseudomonadales bacterium]